MTHNSSIPTMWCTRHAMRQVPVTMSIPYYATAPSTHRNRGGVSAVQVVWLFQRRLQGGASDPGGFGFGSTERVKMSCRRLLTALSQRNDVRCENRQLDTHISRLAIALVD